MKDSALERILGRNNSEFRIDGALIQKTVVNALRTHGLIPDCHYAIRYSSERTELFALTDEEHERLKRRGMEGDILVLMEESPADA